MKTSIKINGNIVALSYDGQDWDGNTTRITRKFMVPAGGGYIREWDADRKEWRQVCDGLSSRGNTLHTNNGDIDNLLAIIRREWQAGKRADKAAERASW